MKIGHGMIESNPVRNLVRLIILFSIVTIHEWNDDDDMMMLLRDDDECVCRDAPQSCASTLIRALSIWRSVFTFPY